MTKCFVIAEGPSDVEVLRRLLGGLFGDDVIHLTDAGGKSSAVSLARTILTRRPNHVALVVDADEDDPERVAATQAELEDALGAVAAAERFGVFLFAPNLESVLLQDEAALRSAFGEKISPEFLEYRRKHPKDALRVLLGVPSNTDACNALLNHLDLERLRRTPPMPQLIDFLGALVRGESTRPLRSILFSE
jgi:hypothetical protein